MKIEMKKDNIISMEFNVAVTTDHASENTGRKIASWGTHYLGCDFAKDTGKITHKQLILELHSESCRTISE